ncbi:unnamed protein product [Thlaspi arvense]|uniref:protein disulfide-isomerase n=1 Tax=Thlaspi arvense TaxID=13288 RepID=A0AAU9S713_THLAR|nr:unnamed protein product [Thlaspi arvense]
MSETQKFTNSTGSIRYSEKIEDTFKKMKVNEDTMEQSSPYPDRPGERDCPFFLRTGQCGYGNSCRYNHPLTHLPHGVFYHRDELPERIGQPDCEYFLKTGACKYGSTCKYHHPKDRNGAGPVVFNVLGYPMRQGEKSCPYYLQTGMCRFGVACKFHHPHPQSHDGHSTYGVSSFPSVGFPYTSGLTMMSMSPATYGVMPPPAATYGAMARPQVPLPQAYMPFMVAPPQGWPTYMAGSNFIYNVKTQLDSSSSVSVPVPVAVTSHHHSFSERAECRFFMNTGTCKYGDDCKYSHPKERMLQSPPSLLNPVVLPSRPGQPACGNFKAYGFCKFGANCKFDHSVPLNPGNNNTGLTMPSLSTASTVSTHLEISSPPSRSDSNTNGDKPAAENHSSEIEKQDDSSEQPDKSEVQEQPSEPSRSGSTALSNGKIDASSERSRKRVKPNFREKVESKRKGEGKMYKSPLTLLTLLSLFFGFFNLGNALYGSSSPVVQLTASNFKSKVLNSNGVVLVEFFAPWCGHCKALTPTWEKVAGILKGVATVAAIDADAHQSAAQDYGIKGFPTIKAFVPGKPPVDYQGARDAKSIANFAYKQIKTLLSDRLEGKSKPNGGSSEKKSESSASVELNSSNFDELVIKSNDLWIVEFFAPWCGHCKKLAPEWKKAANNLKGKVKLGHVNCDVEQSIMSRFKVQGFPTIMVFGADKSSPYSYDGARSASAIESFATELVESSAGPAEVTELTGPDVMEQKCGSAAICFVSFLPDILDSKAEGRNKYLEMLLSVAEKFKKHPYSFVWVAAVTQPDLEKRVSVGGYGYPAMVAMNVKKGVYTPLKSAFELPHLLEFVKDAQAGGKGNLPMNGTPEIVETKAWDGKDGEVIEEDEFSLEELMGGDDNVNVGTTKDEL